MQSSPKYQYQRVNKIWLGRPSRIWVQRRDIVAIIISLRIIILGWERRLVLAYSACKIIKEKAASKTIWAARWPNSQGRAVRDHRTQLRRMLCSRFLRVIVIWRRLQGIFKIRGNCQPRMSLNWDKTQVRPLMLLCWLAARMQSNFQILGHRIRIKASNKLVSKRWM